MAIEGVASTSAPKCVLWGILLLELLGERRWQETVTIRLELKTLSVHTIVMVEGPRHLLLLERVLLLPWVMMIEHIAVALCLHLLLLKTHFETL